MKEKAEESVIMKEGEIVNKCTQPLYSLRCLRREMQTWQIKWLWKIGKYITEI